MRKSILHTLGTLNYRTQSVSAVPRLSRRFGFLGNKKKTYYEILDLQTNASVKDIKKAFMKKAKVYHPDVAKDKFEPEVFKEILEAYETLSDVNRKQTYDLGLSNPAFTEEDIQRHSQNIKENDYSRTFYLNKWYNFKKPEEDLRFEYTDKTEESWVGKALGNLYFKVGLVVTAVVLYDVYQYFRKRRAEQFAASKDKVFGYDQPVTEDVRRLEEYILARELALAESQASEARSR